MTETTNNPASNPAGVKVGSEADRVARFAEYHRQAEALQAERERLYPRRHRWLSMTLADVWTWLFHRAKRRTGFSPVPPKGQPDVK